jgi:hypothetical protein
MIDPDGHMFIQGPQADVGGDSYHVKPTQHNVPKGSSYEPIQRQSVYIAPPKKASPKPAATRVVSRNGPPSYRLRGNGRIDPSEAES